MWFAAACCGCLGHGLCKTMHRGPPEGCQRVLQGLNRVLIKGFCKGLYSFEKASYKGNTKTFTGVCSLPMGPINCRMIFSGFYTLYMCRVITSKSHTDGVTALLGGSWVVIGRASSRPIWAIHIVALLITLCISTHEHPSTRLKVPLHGGSRVVISGVIGKVTIVITHIRGLITIP